MEKSTLLDEQLSHSNNNKGSDSDGCSGNKQINVVKWTAWI